MNTINNQNSHRASGSYVTRTVVIIYHGNRACDRCRIDRGGGRCRCIVGNGSATMLPLSLPLATLLASMMTLGTLGENNELLAIKAAGISLQRVMIPLAAICGIVSVGAFFVSNDLIPVAYNKIYTLRDKANL